MPSSEHKSYQTTLRLALNRLASHPDHIQWIRGNIDIIAILWHLDLAPAGPILQLGYAKHARGGKPWAPLLMLRAFLLAALTGHLAANDWASALRKSELLRALVGITEEDIRGRNTTSPALGAFYGFLHRLHDGPLRNNTDVAVLPSDSERARSRTARISQKHEREKKPKLPDSVTQRLLAQLRAVRPATRPADLLRRLHQLLMDIAIRPSAKAGLLGELGSLFTAADGCVLPTAATGNGHRSCTCEAWRCDCPRTYADPDARWGYDSYRKCFFFGHHFYEISTPVSGHDLPLFIDIHSGNTTDFTASLEGYEYLSKVLRDNGDGWQIAQAALDAGHDALAIHEGLRDWGIRPVIPLSGKAPAVHPDRPSLSLSAGGIPLCSAGVEMASRGSASPGRPLFLCPVKAGKLSQCPYAPADEPGWVCRPDQKCGPSVTVKTSSHPRLFPQISRNSAQYDELYRRRSGCERSNSVKKQAFKLLSCGHRRQSFWLIRLYTMAILQHARAWISGLDLPSFLDELLSPEPTTA